MRKEGVEEIAEFVIAWCMQNVGTSKFYDSTPTIETEYDSFSSVRAEFDALNNSMTLYVKQNRSIRQVVMSVLHEYKHYLQSPTWLERYAAMYRRKQSKNPYEIEAEKFADENWAKCMLDLDVRR